MEEPFGRPFPPAAPGDLEPYFIPPPLPRRNRLWVHVALFVLTIVSTTVIGGLHHFLYSVGFSATDVFERLMDARRTVGFYVRGLWYSASILAILGCHELGHYLACRWYRVEATLPFFLPAPPPVLTGTLGAFIRIRSRIPSKKALFDIAIAGPVAGFLVAIPVLLIGLSLSRIEPIPPDFAGAELGEPLVFRAAAWLVFGDVAPGLSVNMHPMAFAAWFGLLATALNLFPISQLDGGHISHAVLGRKSSYVTLASIGGAVGLTFLSVSWALWTFLMVLMLFLMGPHHPPTLDEETPLDFGRKILALVALAMLIGSFTPVPIHFVTGN